MACYVYVIELPDTVGPRRRPRLPNILVGDTCKSVEERFGGTEGETLSR